MKQVIVCLLAAFVAVNANAAKLDYRIEQGQFITSEGPIPPGCFAQLMSELNGDNSVAAIYINRANLRGCIAANYPYPGGDETRVRYEIAKQGWRHRFNLKVCVEAEGSLGDYCDRITVRFTNRKYSIQEGTKRTLVLEKLGEW